MSESIDSHRGPPNTKEPRPSSLQRVILAGAGVAIAGGLLCALGWFLGIRELAAFGGNYVPMAPTMVLLVFLLGTGLLVCGPGSARTHRVDTSSPEEGSDATERSVAIRSVAGMAAALCVIVGTGVLLRAAGVFHYDFEKVLADQAGTLGGSSTGRMPWLAAVLVVCAGLPLLGLQWPRAPRAVVELISVLTMAAAGLSLAVLMGYAYGAPLLYRGATIPVALPTAVAFLALAVGLIAAIPSSSRVVGFFRGPTMRARLLRAFLPTTLVLVLLVGWAGNTVLDSATKNAALSRWVLTLGSIFAVALVILAVTRRTGDIIDRAERSARQQLADEALEFAQNVIDTVREPLISLDQDLRVVTVSRSFYDFFKVKPEDTVGQLIYDLGNKQWDIPKLRELLETILPQQTSFDNYEVEHDFAGVGKRAMLLNARQIEQGVGKERIILLAIEDVTERKEAEASQRESASYARSLLEASLDPLVTISAEGKITDVNEASVQATGVAREQLIGGDFSDYFTEPDRAREGYQKAFSEGFVRDYPLRIRHSTGRISDVMYNAAVYRDDKGSVLGVFAAARDITERKDMEAGLEESRKELEAFAYSVSHDLRAPLRGIDGWSLALLEDYKDKLDERGCEYIDLVRSETQRMGCLIDDLLTFSRQSRGEMSEERLDMTAMVQAIAARLCQQMPSLQAEFVIQPGLTALGDAGLIGAALTNLLDNAVKFSGGNPHAIVEFGQVDQEGKKAFFVRDNGAGFDMAYSNKLFGVFQRLHKLSDFPGTGIGLASAQRIISRHGGRIWAEAKVGQGATFHFTLKEAS